MSKQSMVRTVINAATRVFSLSELVKEERKLSEAAADLDHCSDVVTYRKARISKQWKALRILGVEDGQINKLRSQTREK